MLTSGKGNNPYQQADPLYSRSNGADRLGTVHRPDGDNHGGTVVKRPPLFAGIMPADYARISSAARV